MRKYFTIFLIVLFLGIATSALGENFYCDCSDSGETTGTGTYNDPFVSIADIEAYEAATGFADGDDIYFEEGSTCTATSDLDIKWEGTGTGNYSILGCYDGEDDFDCDAARPIIQMSTTTDTLLYLSEPTSYFKFHYLNIRNTHAGWEDTGSNGIGTKGDHLGGNGEEGYITIDDCIFYHWGHYAVALAQIESNLIITNSTCTWSGNCFYIIEEGADSESVTASYDGYIARNTCSDIVGYYSVSQEEKTDGHCVGLQTTVDYIVEDNESTNAYNTAYILWVKDNRESNHNVFRRNKSDGNRQIGFSIYHPDGDPGGHGNLVYQSIDKSSADETSKRSAIRFNCFNDSEGNYAFNNTIYDAGYAGLEMRSVVGCTTDYINFWNNIVVVDGVSTSDNELVFVQEAGTNGANSDVDYNLYWTVPNTDPSSYALWDPVDGGTALDWADWKTDGWGPNGDVDNPDFVDLTDFELESYSPAVDTGRPLTHITSATGSGTSFTVSNPWVLHDDKGLLDEDGNAIDGMLISLFDTTLTPSWRIENAEIVGINYATSTVTVSQSVSWKYNASYPNDTDETTQITLRMKGTGLDKGAKEYDAADVTAPTLSSVTIPAAGTTVIMDFDESVTESGTGSDWSMTMSGGSVTLSSPNVSSDTITYTTSRTIEAGESLSDLDYTQPGNGIEDLSSNDLASISNYAGTFNNNSTADVTAPTLDSVTIPSAGTTIVMDFDENVSESGTGSDWSLTMSGGAATLSSPNVSSDTITYNLSRTVQSGETLTDLDYTQPGNGIEDIADNDLVSISNYAGTFNNNSTQGVSDPKNLSVGALIDIGSNEILTIE